MKGNLLIAHGGGPTAVINASLAGVVREAKKHPEIGGIYAAKRGIEGLLKEDFLCLGFEPMERIEKLPYSPSSAIYSCRYKVKDQDYSRIIEVIKKYDFKYFLYNGGNDSMDTCNKVNELARDLDLRVIGVPKTIDNDLAFTDHSPGFGSAARYIAVSTMELGLDIEALNIHVCVIEYMGRNAGWMTAAASLARQWEGAAPALIYVPEVAFNEEDFLERVSKRFKESGGFVVAVSEGLRDAQGNMLVSPKHKSAVDGFGHVLPGNVSQYLADLITQKLNIRARSEKPGLLGRASICHQSSVDREEAIQVGEFAVRSAVAGKTGFMVGIKRVSSKPYKSELELVPLAKVANVENMLPKKYIVEGGYDITPEYAEYCMPLLGDPLPYYERLSKSPAKKR